MSRIQNDIENVGITRVPMRFKLNNNGEPKREFWNSHKRRCPIYREIKRFIKARVGKNVDKVYSEFCSKYPISSHGVLTHDEFWDYIARGDQDNRWKDFYVDANKCIKEIKRDNNKDRKHIKLCPNGETIIDYSIYDAVEAGFGKVVYIVREYFREQMEQTIKQLYSHPCIVAYTIFNEGWGQFNSDAIYHKAKELDSTRLYDSTSGWFAQKENDFDIYSDASSVTSSNQGKDTHRAYRVSIRRLCFIITRCAKNYYEKNKEKFDFINYNIINLDEEIARFRK